MYNGKKGMCLLVDEATYTNMQITTVNDYGMKMQHLLIVALEAVDIKVDNQGAYQMKAAGHNLGITLLQVHFRNSV